MLKELPVLKEDEEEVSYDVESLFTSVPIKDTINYICTEIYTENKLKPICKESIFRKLLLKLTTECSFSFAVKIHSVVNFNSNFLKMLSLQTGFSLFLV